VKPANHDMVSSISFLAGSAAQSFPSVEWELLKRNSPLKSNSLEQPASGFRWKAGYPENIKEWKNKIKTLKKKKVTAYLSIHNEAGKTGSLILLQVRIVNYTPTFWNLWPEAWLFCLFKANAWQHYRSQQQI